MADSEEVHPRNREVVAYLFTNVQSGDIESSTDPDFKQGEASMWSRQPLVLAGSVPALVEDDRLRELYQAASLYIEERTISARYKLKAVLGSLPTHVGKPVGPLNVWASGKNAGKPVGEDKQDSSSLFIQAATDLARNYARNCSTGDRAKYDYLKGVDASWKPHEWVVWAIMDAYRQGEQKAKGAIHASNLQSIAGFPLVADSSVPTDEIRMVHDGKVLGTIKTGAEPVTNTLPGMRKATALVVAERGSAPRYKMEFVFAGEWQLYCAIEAWSDFVKQHKEVGEEAKSLPTPGTPSGGFIGKTNREYALWCKTKYHPSALNEFGMKSLDGLHAWQEQERRYAPSAVVSDSSLLDWLSMQVVDVRTSLLHGSLAGFLATPVADDSSAPPRPSSLRAQAIAAMSVDTNGSHTG